MSNNMSSNGKCARYDASLEVWAVVRDVPKEVSYRSFYSAMGQCLQSINHNKLLRMQRLVLYLAPVGTYAGNHKISSYRYDKAVKWVRFELSKQDLRHFCKHRFNSTKFLDRIANALYESVYSVYDETIHNQVSWICITQEQFQYQQARNKLVPCTSSVIQAQQGKLLHKILNLSEVELTEKIDLASFLKALRMSFLEFEKIYIDYHRYDKVE